MAKAGSEGKVVLIAGNKDHPEVKGIIGHCNGEVYTFNNSDELEDLTKIIPSRIISKFVLLLRLHLV